MTKSQSPTISFEDLDIGVVVHPRQEWPVRTVAPGPKQQLMPREVVLHTTQAKLHVDTLRRKVFAPRRKGEEELAVVAVVLVGKQYWIVDGHHSVAASRLREDEAIPVYLYRPSTSMFGDPIDPPKLAARRRR